MLVLASVANFRRWSSIRSKPPASVNNTADTSVDVVAAASALVWKRNSRHSITEGCGWYVCRPTHSAYFFVKINKYAFHFGSPAKKSNFRSASRTGIACRKNAVTLVEHSPARTRVQHSRMGATMGGSGSEMPKVSTCCFVHVCKDVSALRKTSVCDMILGPFYFYLFRVIDNSLNSQRNYLFIFAFIFFTGWLWNGTYNPVSLFVQPPPHMFSKNNQRTHLYLKIEVFFYSADLSSVTDTSSSERRMGFRLLIVDILESIPHGKLLGSRNTRSLPATEPSLPCAFTNTSVGMLLMW